jgi:type I restriction enzyme S subunit
MGISGCIHDGWLVLSPKKPISSDFFYHILGSKDLYAKFMQLAAGATVKNLNIDLVKGVEVVLPPLDEQRRIAAILDQADDLHRGRQEALAQLGMLPQSILSETFGDPILNPHGFPIVPLEQVINPKRPITYGILMPGPHLEDGVPYIRVVDIQDGTIEAGTVRNTSLAIASQYKRSELVKGDILISIRGHVGRLAIVPSELDGANITQDTARLAVTGAEPIFVKSLLETQQAKSWMDRRTKGAAVKGLNLGDLRQLPIMLPPLESQCAFADVIGEIDRLKARHHAHLVHLDGLFASLQHRAFRGEL